MRGRGRRRGLLLSSSVAALLVGGGAPPAFAACANISAAFDNPAGNTPACVTVTNTSFTGNITNEGTISPSGIAVIGVSAFDGGIANAGSIVNAGRGIVVGGTTASSFVSTFSGGVTNTGTIVTAPAGTGIFV